MKRCSWCPEHDPAPAAGLVAVGFLEQGSGGGWIYYACPSCLAEQELVPLAEHPPESTGRPLTRARWQTIVEALTCGGLLLTLIAAALLRR